MLGGFIGRALTPYAVQLENCYVANVRFPAGYESTKYTSGIQSHLYAFMNTGGKTVSDINCYSELTGGEGAHPQTYQYYKAEYDTVAKPASTKNDILTGFENNDKFDVNTEINDGYPHLYFETVKVKPDYIIKSINKKPMTLDYTGEKGSFSGKLVGESEITVEVEKNTDEAANVYIASYDIDGRVINAKSAAVNKADFSFTADVDMEKAKYLKVFLWDSNFGSVHEPYSATSVDASGIGEMWPYVAEIGVRKTNVILMGDSLTDSVWNGSSYSWPKYGWEGYIGEYFDEDEINLVKHGHGG